MTLQISALDAMVGALATAFFGGLLAAQAYLLKHILSVQNEVRALAARLERLAALEATVRQMTVGLVSPEPLTAAPANQEVG